MKKILASLLCAACLAFAGSASAAVQEFGPDFARFTVDVKDWTPTATPNGASFLSPDSSCNVVVAVDKHGGNNAETIAKAVVQQAGVSNAQEVSKDAKSCTMKGTIQGKDILISVSVEGDNFYCISINGDIQKGASFIETLDEKK
ncbi:MAG: hypothetical protein II132_01945 [Desulfovibrio sp.]|jgi:hypothetical protein|nr:hypothetical protein [Desulfovibrio sp.]MBQ1538896.1 hypothetical protein [Desulfovibrio sp.]MBQ1844697.1 hypothetical protein [Desulfovibrio sp.]MBQ2516559.1 hypothetical protein [Desulfovibrio sp.]